MVAIRFGVLLALLVLCDGRSLGQRIEESHCYKRESIAIPNDLSLEVGGMELHLGRFLLATRQGEVFEVFGFDEEDLSRVEFRRVFRGLHEPLGLLSHQGWLYVVQRGELSRLKDEDGDGTFDELETVCDSWSLSGNYHEYNFGPQLGPDGESLWITTNKPFGNEPFGRVPWRGFALRITRSGEMIPECSGLRSPSGLERSPTGELFYSDNQGEWCGASKISELKPGDYHGHPWGTFSCKLPEWNYPRPRAIPSGTLMPDAAAIEPNFRLPAIWFPYDKMGKSPTGFRWDTTNGSFGPFSNQVFVADQHHAAVLRVSLEKVDGHWQGACYPFRGGLTCGATRLLFTPKGNLYVGETDRGWASKGTKPFGLDRLSYTGKLPFEILDVRAMRDGFRIRFTQRVSAQLKRDAFALSSYTYKLQEEYGSPEVNHEVLRITDLKLSEDRQTIELRVVGLRLGYVHEIQASGVRSDKDLPLLHDRAYYTLIKLPINEDPDPRTSNRKTTTHQEEPAFVSLFDGKTLKGWKSTWDKGTVNLHDGEIHLTSPGGMFFLATEKSYDDFIFEAEVNIPNKGNSGIQFRSQVKDRRVVGYQAEVDPTDRRWAGGLYDQDRRAWVHPLTGDEKAMTAFKRDEWNHYRIECRGHHIRILLNGVLTSDLLDPLDLEGHFGLQHHGEAGLTYRFRNLRIAELSGHRIMPLPILTHGPQSAQREPKAPIGEISCKNSAPLSSVEFGASVDLQNCDNFAFTYELGQSSLKVLVSGAPSEVELFTLDKGGIVGCDAPSPGSLRALHSAKNPYDPAKPHRVVVIRHEGALHVWIDGIPYLHGEPTRWSDEHNRLTLRLQVEAESAIRVSEFRTTQAKPSSSAPK
jgi:hypothetical protein